MDKRNFIFGGLPDEKEERIAPLKPGKNGKNG